MTLKIFDPKVRFLIPPPNGWLFFAKNWKKTNSCVKAHKTLNYQVSTFSFPSGSRADLHPRPEGPSLRMDGMNGWMGRNIKSVLHICLYWLLFPEGKRRRSNCFYLYIIWVRKGILKFRFSGGNPPFWNLENVLSPKGTLRSRTQWGPFDSLSILLCLRKGVWTFRFSGGNPPFWNLENVLSPEGKVRKHSRWGPIDFSWS